MLIKHLFLLLISSLLSSCSSSLTEPVLSFQVQNPRPFGYVIGDEINQRILVEVRHGMDLQYSSLPSKGSINRWLNLNKVSIKKNKGSEGDIYQIDMTYQLFYAPLEVKMLDLPNFTLHFRQFGNTVKQDVPVWHFTAAPLRELAIRQKDGKEYMRPDINAPLLKSDAAITRLLVFLAIALATGLYLAWLYGLLTFLPKYQIFKKPARQMAKLSGENADRLFSIMHNALNKLNGKPLFNHRITDFYQRFPRYQQLNTELAWFFKQSNQHFFSADNSWSANDAEKIRILCQHCLEIERGKR
jgi:mxaA protein